MKRITATVEWTGDAAGNPTRCCDIVSTDWSHVCHLERYCECKRGTEDAYASWIDETEQKGTNDDFTVLSRRRWATLQIGMLLYELHMIYRRQKVSATRIAEVKKSKGLPWWLSGKASAWQVKERQIQSLIQEDPTCHGATSLCTTTA